MRSLAPVTETAFFFVRGHAASAVTAGGEQVKWQTFKWPACRRPERPGTPPPPQVRRLDRSTGLRSIAPPATHRMIASATESVYGRRQPARRPARRGHGLAGPTVQIETNLVLLLPALIEQNKLLSFISRRNIERGTRVKEVPFGEKRGRSRGVGRAGALRSETLRRVIRFSATPPCST